MSRFAALLLALLTFAALGSSPAAALLSRPPGEGPTEVEIAVVIVDVDDINSANQTFTANVYVELAWMDSTLAAPAEDEGPRVVPLDSIWHRLSTNSASRSSSSAPATRRIKSPFESMSAWCRASPRRCPSPTGR